jgi:hypothetical protein
MPIKPENLKLYPPDWKAISLAAKELAGWRCQHQDAPAHRCGARQYAVGHWAQSDLWRLPLGFDQLQRRVWRWVPAHGNGYHDAAGQGLGWPDLQRWTFAEARQFAAESFFSDPDAPKPIVIVLTVAHLNHDPTDCRPENLRAMCQRHHLAYDHDHHRANAWATRRARAGTMELFSL